MIKIDLCFRLSEAEGALSSTENLKCNLEDVVKEFGDQACFSLQLLGKIYARTEQLSKSFEANRKALQLCPFLWNSFTELCNKGDKPDPQQIFQVPADTLYSSTPHIPNIANSTDKSIDLNNVQSACVTPMDYSTPIMNPATPTVNCPPTNRIMTPEDSPFSVGLNISCISGITNLQAVSKQLHFNRLNSTGTSSPATPSFGFLPLESPQLSYVQTPVQSAALTEANDQKSSKKQTLSSLRSQMGLLISRKDSPVTVSKPPVFSQSGNVSNTTPQSTVPTSNIHSAQVRRSSRLFTNNYSVKENNKSPNRNKFATPKSPRKPKQRLTKTNLGKTNYEITEKTVDKEKIETITSDQKVILNNSINSAQTSVQQLCMLQKQSIEGLMILLRQLGRAYLSLTQFQCQKAIDVLLKVPRHHFNTGWVLTTLGMAYMELTDYESAIKYFEMSHELEPFRLDQMDMYSTALWHLQKEVVLSSLAQDLMAQNKTSPVSLLVAGNCFSLHKEHDTAIKFFERAVQVDPKYVYAYTLLGHELVNTEELDKAMSCFRNAIRLNSRHYNAWFGIGTIYSKQERFQLAEIHYKRAFLINRQSSVLMCHIGVVQHALGKTDKALQTLNQAIELNPKNPLSKFHRGSIYFSIGRNQEALKELEELKEMAPKESLVYYLIGKVHKKMGNVHLALMHFSWATDLDPKGANNQIKEAFDPNTSGNTEEDGNTSNDANITPEEQALEQIRLRNVHMRLFSDEPEPELSDVEVSY